MSHSSPPARLCVELDIDARVTWGEAILIVLGQAAMSGDVSAAREVLAALGISGTASRTNVLVNLESSEQRNSTFEFLKHSHGLSEEQLLAVWEFMDSLPRQKTTIDASFFPDASYCEGIEHGGGLLTEGTQEEEL